MQIRELPVAGQVLRWEMVMVVEDGLAGRVRFVKVPGRTGGKKEIVVDK
jgi:hypothetical protein